MSCLKTLPEAHWPERVKASLFRTDGPDGRLLREFLRPNAARSLDLRRGKLQNIFVSVTGCRRIELASADGARGRDSVCERRILPAHSFDGSCCSAVAQRVRRRWRAPDAVQLAEHDVYMMYGSPPGREVKLL